MPAVWFALKRSMNCKSERREVHDPNIKNLSNIVTKKSRSSCSKSIANLKDVVIHGSKRHTEKPPMCSPRSIGSSELLNPITHEVVLNNSTCQLKISTGSGGELVGVLNPGTPHIRRSYSSLSRRPRSSECNGAPFCVKCGEQFLRWEAVEAHHLSKHAVTELVEGDSSKKIVEIICRASCSNKSSDSGIERILKVHNMQKTIAQFEEYREVVKIKASKLSKKHPRCLADGNELLRFHGATLECSLGMKGLSTLCSWDKCRVCRILRYGFSSNQDLSQGIGVFTASTSGKAFEKLDALDDNPSQRKALIVCRVIAGRVHRPVEKIDEMVGQSGFDSLAGKVGVHANIEELYLLSPRALLPCFVVVYKP